MVKHALDSSLDKLCVNFLTVQISSGIAASFVIVCIKFIWKWEVTLMRFNLRLCNKRHWIALMESYLLIVEHSYLLVSYYVEN